jgi:hypothetical protein
LSDIAERKAGLIGGILALRRRAKLGLKRLRMERWSREYEEILSEPDHRKRFDRLYTQRIWSRNAKSPETGCGSGSTLASTAVFREELERFLSLRTPGVFFDAPCGDFHFMSTVCFPAGWHYIGGDLSPSAIRDACRKAPATEFREFDLTRDKFPANNVWLCRACLFHLSFSDIRKVLENFARSDGKIAIITSLPDVRENVDIATGHYRPLDLTKLPIGLPKPHEFLNDVPDDPTPWIAGIWSREEVASALQCDRRILDRPPRL